MADQPNKKNAPAPQGAGASARPVHKDSDAGIDKAFLRAENEDDDGYDPYSDRRPAKEPLFERDPWA